MEGFQALIALVQMVMLLIPAIACTSYGLYQLIYGRSNQRLVIGLASIGVACLLLLVIYGVLKGAPAFDVIDRCHRVYWNSCFKKGLDAVQAEVHADLMRAYVRYVLLPLFLGSGLILLVARRPARPTRSN